jgi:myo-inositol-1(or 4)-monophosphatase
MTLQPRELDEIVAEARACAEEAGALLLCGLGNVRRIDYKGDVDLLTEYDKRSEELIVARLLARFPSFAVCGEEGGVHGDPAADTIWYVDPLDGTTNFAHGHPVFAVSIGLSHRGALVAGVVNAPALGLCAWARTGGGAFANGAPIRVSAIPGIDVALVATGFPYDRRVAVDDNTREYAAFVKRAQAVRRIGAASVDLLLVARGAYDGYFEQRLKPWDIAAGAALVAEAGGRVTDYEGAPLDLDRCWIAASNGLVHDEMLAIVRAARAGLPS